MRFFLTGLAILCTVLLGLRTLMTLGFPPERQEEALPLLVERTARASTIEAFRRARPADVLKLLQERILTTVPLSDDERELRHAYALVYYEALRRLPQAERDPGDHRRAAFLKLANDSKVDDPALRLYCLGIAALCGFELDPAWLQPRLLEDGNPAAITPAELIAFPYALAASGLEDAAPRIRALEKSYGELDTVGTATRLAAARCLHYLRDPTGIDLLIRTLRLVKQRSQERQIQDELQHLTGAAIDGDADLWADWWATQRERFRETGKNAGGPWFSIRPSLLIWSIMLAACYLMIVKVSVDHRWTNLWGASCLGIAAFLFVRQQIENHLTASRIPYTPYALEDSPLYIVDAWILPFFAWQFLMVAVFLSLRTKKAAPDR